MSISHQHCRQFVQQTVKVTVEQLGKPLQRWLVVTGIGFGGWAIALPAEAHHPTGGETPSNLWEGLLSGLAHPVIGLDHLAFVVAIGLLAATLRRGLALPIGFVLATLFGTGIHLRAWDLPVPELFISLSVLVFGLILALGKRLNFWAMLVLGAIAGLFHGYAYGEAIIGAEMTPLVAYLAGFALVQMGIAISTQGIAQRLLGSVDPLALRLRFAGFTLSGAGAVFLSSVLLG